MSKKEIENKTVKKSVNKVAVVKKAAVKKAPIKKTAVVKKAAVKKAPIKKTTEVKKVAVKKAPVKKTAMVKKDVVVKKEVSSKRVKINEDLVSIIIKAMEDKKANNIVCLDLTTVESAVTDYFIICDAQSGTQVEAIARNIEDEVQKQLKEKPFHSEGYQNAEWILIDYFNVVAHVFVDEKRDFYRLEKLWADAEVQKVG